MLARVPIISAYDPSRESMLAHASPSCRIARIITGTCYRLPRDKWLSYWQKLSTFITLQFIRSFILAKYSKFYPCKLVSYLFPVKQTSSVHRVVSVVDRTWGNICSTFSSSLNSTLLLIENCCDPLYLWVIKTFFGHRCQGAIAWGEYSHVCLFALSLSSFYFLFLVVLYL